MSFNYPFGPLFPQVPTTGPSSPVPQTYQPFYAYTPMAGMGIENGAFNSFMGFGGNPFGGQGAGPLDRMRSMAQPGDPRQPNATANQPMTQRPGYDPLAGYAPQAPSAAPAPQEPVGSSGKRGVLGAVESYLTDPQRGDNRLAMILGGLGLGLNAYGQYQEGRRKDREDRDERKRRRGMSTLLDAYMGSVG